MSVEAGKTAAVPECCPGMEMVLGYANGHQKKVLRPRSLAGIQEAIVFEQGTMKHKGSQLVYVLPGRGQGKARQLPQNIVMDYCPFCGKKQGKR